MFVKDYTFKTKHQRPSKSGKVHTYFRYKAIVVLQCDSCNTVFERPKGSMDPKRLSNNYFHVCNDCDTYKFAQRKGVERKQIWNMPASSDIPIGKLQTAKDSPQPQEAVALGFLTAR